MDISPKSLLLSKTHWPSVHQKGPTENVGKDQWPKWPCIYISTGNKGREEQLKTTSSSQMTYIKMLVICLTDTGSQGYNDLWKLLHQNLFTNGNFICPPHSCTLLQKEWLCHMLVTSAEILKWISAWLSFGCGYKVAGLLPWNQTQQQDYNTWDYIFCPLRNCQDYWDYHTAERIS